MYGNRGVTLSPHCVERFHERFRPALDQIRARRELEMLLSHGEISDEPPEWLARKMLQEADAYLIVGTDLVLPLAEIGARASGSWRRPASIAAASPRPRGGPATTRSRADE